MAGADYYSCDVCGCKTFYDANIAYSQYEDENMNPNSGHIWPDGDVGDMLVICKECAKTHKIALITKDKSEIK